MTERICSVEGCGRSFRSKGLCTSHWYRVNNGLPLDTPIRPYESGERRCKLLGCNQKRASDGTYCAMHLTRLRRTGQVGMPTRYRMPPGQAIWDKPNSKRRHILAANYGITPEQYAELFDSQGRCCAVCKSESPGGRHSRSPNRSDWHWAVDHDHVTGRIRGLLCDLCNRAIGMFKDDPEIIAAATRYVAQSRIQ